MLSEEEKLKSIEKIKLLKEECKNIKQEFEKAKEQREMHFQKKESLKKEIIPSSNSAAKSSQPE